MARIRTRLLWSGTAVLLVVASLVLLASAQAQGTAAGAAGKAISAAQVARSSPVGLWRASNGRLFRWVAISGGYEKGFENTRTLPNSCPGHAGDAASRFSRIRDDLYREVDQVWRGVCVRWWCGRCRTDWEAAGTVKILVSSNRITVSCADRPERVCETYTRVSS